MPRQKRKTKQKIYKKSEKPKKNFSGKLILLLVFGVILDILLTVGIVFVLIASDDTSVKLAKYRDLQARQIASVTELCFDIGNTNSLFHGGVNDERLTLSVVMSFGKDEYSSAYEDAFKDICYKPLLLISGVEFSETGSNEERAQKLLEDKTSGGNTTDVANYSKYSVKENAFDAVRW